MRTSKKLPAALAEHLAASVHKSRRRYHKRLECCQKKFSEEAVHDLRVETRRILALLDVIAALGFDGSIKKLCRNFKKRLDVFDDLRDTQVQLQHLKPLWRRFPEVEPLKSILQRRESKLIARLAHKIKTTRDTRLNQRLKEMQKCVGSCADDRSRKDAVRLAASALRGTFRRVLTLRRQVRASEPATIHRMRVSFKRFRYVSELLRPLLPGLTPAQIDRMKAYQVAAGEIQDLEVLLGRLAKLVADRKLSPAAVRNLRNDLLRQKREAIDSFMARIDDLLEFEAHHPGCGQKREALMKLYILRHGEAAEHGDPRYKENDRPLTPKGIQRTKQLAHTLREMDISFDSILSSPLTRARQTAEIVARGIRPQREVELTEYLTPSGSMEKLVEAIHIMRPVPDDVLLVGHEPYLSCFISLLCVGGTDLPVRMKKGALCRLEVEALSCGRCAILEWLLQPRLIGVKPAKRGDKSGNLKVSA